MTVVGLWCLGNRRREIGLAGIFQDIPLVGHQDDEAFCFGPLFQLVNFSDRFGIGGIAADAPDRIGRIEDETAGLENREAMSDAVSISFSKNPSLFHGVQK
jgi:hypothetical protein